MPQIPKVKKAATPVDMAEPTVPTPPPEPTQLEASEPIETPIVLTETYDHEALLLCLNHSEVSDEVKSALRSLALKSTPIKDTNLHMAKVSYDFAKNHKTTQLGRLWANKGAQKLKRNVRSALYGKLYHDLDMVCAQPTLLLNIAKRLDWPHTILKTYIERREAILADCVKHYDDVTLSRDDAKDLFNIMLYLGGESTWRTENSVATSKPPFPFAVEFQREMNSLGRLMVTEPEFEKVRTEVNTNPAKGMKKRKPDDVSMDAIKATMSYVLTTAENKCLSVARKVLMKHGRDFQSLMFDGGLTQRLADGVFPQSILDEIKTTTQSLLGYSVTWIEKQMTQSLDFTGVSKSEGIEGGTGLIDDDYATRAYIALMKDEIARDEVANEILVFNPKTGLWSSDVEDARASITRNASRLTFTSEDGKKVHNYGGDLKKMTTLLAMVKNSEFLPATPFIESHGDSSKHKFLFTNGIYDANTDSFTEGFDKSVVFFARINRPYSTKKDRELMGVIKKMLFEDPFISADDPTNAMGKFYLDAWTRALVGEYGSKKFYIATGNSNSGKGLVTDALMSAFNGYITTYNANELKSTDGLTVDEAKKFMWLSLCRKSRAMIANEVGMVKSFDGNKMKMLSGGGDRITYRVNNKDPVSILWRTVPFILCNDLPTINPVDSGIRTRLRYLRYKKSFVETDDPSKLKDDELPAIKDIKSKFASSTEYQNALFHVIMENWAEIKDTVCEDPKCVTEETLNWLGDPEATTVGNILKAEFVITKDARDCVPFSELKAYLLNSGLVGFSDTKLGREFNALGLGSDTRRYDTKVTKVRTGIREKTDMEKDVEALADRG